MLFQFWSLNLSRINCWCDGAFFLTIVHFHFVQTGTAKRRRGFQSLFARQRCEGRMHEIIRFFYASCRKCRAQNKLNCWKTTFRFAFLLNSGWHKASWFWIHGRYITCWRFCTSSTYAWGHLEASSFIIRFPLIDSRLSLHLIPLSIISILKLKSVNGKQLLMQMLPDETSR